VTARRRAVLASEYVSRPPLTAPVGDALAADAVRKLVPSWSVGDMDWGHRGAYEMHELMISGWGRAQEPDVARRDSGGLGPP